MSLRVGCDFSDSSAVPATDHLTAREQTPGNLSSHKRSLVSATNLNEWLPQLGRRLLDREQRVRQARVQLDGKRGRMSTLHVNCLHNDRTHGDSPRGEACYL